MCLVGCRRWTCEKCCCSCLRLRCLCDDDGHRSCSNGSSTIFISPPTVDELFNAAPSADYSILARSVRWPSVSVCHVVCAILGDQQDVKHGIAREVGVEWINNTIARTALHIRSMVAKFPLRLKGTKDCGVVEV